MGRSHFSFGGERKVCKRKPAARRLREKALYCPFCRRGSLCRAQHDWPDFTCNPARSELAFFRHQNGRAFFPPLPIAALFPAVGGGQTYLLQVKMVPTAWRSCSAKYESFCFRRSRRGAYAALAGLLLPMVDGGQAYPMPDPQAARPSVERRSVSASWQEITPDPRAARPVAERR